MATPLTYNKVNRDLIARSEKFLMKLFSTFHRCSLSHCKMRYYSRISIDLKDKPRPKAKWEAVIGLEVHAQIASRSKLFSEAACQFAAPINSRVAHFDAALPGTLPKLNTRCVEAAVMTAHAIGASLNLVSTFDRKHYFYADQPAGYQITQQRRPLAVGGCVSYLVPPATPGEQGGGTTRREARITQLQLEQDSGKSLHDTDGQLSLIDLNRAGVGLMEIVTEPEFHNAAEAVAFVRELQLILVTIGSCNGRMDEGALRVDASVSVRHTGEPLGTRSEVKNLNSLRHIGKAIEFEIERQIAILEKNEKVENETRAFDVENGVTVSMRDKERVHDYRFLPEPNLPCLRLYTDDTAPTCADPQVINVDAVRRAMPELPGAKRSRLASQYDIQVAQAINLVNDPPLVRFFEEVMQVGQRSATTVLKLLLNDLLGALYRTNLTLADSPVTPSQFGEIVDLLISKSISAKISKKIFSLLCEGETRSVSQLIADHNWTQLTDAATLHTICDTVLSNNPSVVAQYKGGKTKVMNYLMAQAMIATDGRAQPTVLTSILREKLK